MVVGPIEGSRGWSQSWTVQDPKRDPERLVRVKLTDPHGRQPLERSDDWRAGRSRGGLREQLRSIEEQEGAEGELEESSAEAKRRPLSHPRSAQQRTFRQILPK